jgi:S-adenosylmethionine hydrolase
VAAAAAPASRLIDLTHGIDAHDVRQASYVLSLSLDYLPADAIVVVVVDPGVGSARRGLVAAVGGRMIVVPDNGLLTDTLAISTDACVVTLDSDAVTRITGASPRGATFHGRDIFAPVAGALARGIGMDELGNDAGEVVRLPDTPSVSLEAGTGRITGTGRWIDHFGNVLSDIPGPTVRRVLGDAAFTVSVGGLDIGPLRRTYADGAKGELIALLNSWDRVEAAVCEGRAVDRLGGRDTAQIRFVLEAR